MKYVNTFFILVRLESFLQEVQSMLGSRVGGPKILSEKITDRHVSMELHNSSIFLLTL